MCNSGYCGQHSYSGLSGSIIYLSSANYSGSNYSGIERITANYSVSPQYFSSPSSPSFIETIAMNYTPLFNSSRSQRKTYSSSGYDDENGTAAQLSKMYFVPDLFLRQNREISQFIGKAEEIQEFIEEAFLKTTGFSLPTDIVINVLDSERFNNLHFLISRNNSDHVLGFAINRTGTGMPSEIFIRSDSLDRVLLVAGHEIGHVMNLSINNIIDEEAKAFAFTIAWMETIKEHDIAGIGKNIKLEAPASNGVHNVALEFVLDSIEKGISSMNLFNDISLGRTSAIRA